MKIITSKDEGKVLLRYLYFLMSTMNKATVASEHKRQWISNYSLIKVPIPPMEEQERIVGILDRFETMVHSIKEGLPREIELRRKQYEYFRDQLLTFPKD